MRLALLIGSLVLHVAAVKEDYVFDPFSELNPQGPVYPDKLDLTSNILDQFNTTNATVSRTRVTVNCGAVNVFCRHSPSTASTECPRLLEECFTCAYLEDGGCELTAYHNEVEVENLEYKSAMCAVASAQRCYNAVFNFGTTLVTATTLGYSCEQAKRTCDQASFNYGFDETANSSTQALDVECRQQYTACLSCQDQERMCRSQDSDLGLLGTRAFCTTQAVTCFGEAMTLNGTHEHVFYPSSDDEAEGREIPSNGTQTKTVSTTSIVIVTQTHYYGASTTTRTSQLVTLTTNDTQTTMVKSMSTKVPPTPTVFTSTSATEIVTVNSASSPGTTTRPLRPSVTLRPSMTPSSTRITSSGMTI